MNNTVKRVTTTLKIMFSNGTNYTIPCVNPHDSQNPDLSNYATDCKLKLNLYKGTNTNVIGNIAGSTLSITGKSIDKLLLPSNESSTYYGLMNNTARIEVKVTGDDNVETNKGVYYVDSWECGASSSDYDTFNITCVDLMSKIKGISLTKVRLKLQMKFSEYLKKIIDTLNTNLPSDMQIIYSIANLEKMDELYSANWSMNYNNIDRDTVENVFNELSQNTLSYIWIDGNRTLHVDSLLNEEETGVCDLSGLVNLFSYSSQQGDICDYSGIRVEYIETMDYQDQELLNMSDVKVYKGPNTITSQLNSDKAIKINVIEVTTDDVTKKAVCTGFSNYKNSIDMNIQASDDCVCNIKVYGTVVNEAYNTLTRYKDDNNKNSLLEIKNKILRAEDIPTFVYNYLRLISMKNSLVEVEGYINPQLKLSDTVSMVGSRLGISSYYKVIGLEFSLTTNYRCTATLMKTIEGELSVEVLLINDHAEVRDILKADIDTTYQFFNATAEQEVLINKYIGTELAELQEFM